MATGNHLSKRKAAQWLDVSEKTIDRLRTAGLLDSIKVGRLVRVSVASPEAYTAASCRRRRPTQSLTRSRSGRSTRSAPRGSPPRGRTGGRMSGAPSERFLAQVERELKKLPRGAQKAVGGGVYMRLDRSGRRRFQYRTRAGGGQSGGTFDGWQEAHDTKNEADAAPAHEAADGEPTTAELRRWEVARYAGDA
jgi:hypothetical protein